MSINSGEAQFVSFQTFFGCIFNAASAEPDAPLLKIGIVGDSTVCDYPAHSRQLGWGQSLPLYFSDRIVFLNEAQKGRSTNTFPPDPWKKVLDFKPDFILIQFGHNDSHPKTRPESTVAVIEGNSKESKSPMKRIVKKIKKC